MKGKIDKNIFGITELISWIAIFIAPTLIGLIVGLLVYFNLGGDFGHSFGVFIFLLGIIIGIRFAEWARKKEGTNNFMTRLHSTTTKPKEKTDKLNDL